MKPTLGLQKHRNALPHQGMVFGNYHSNHGRVSQKKSLGYYFSYQISDHLAARILQRHQFGGCPNRAKSQKKAHREGGGRDYALFG
ncbi:hypothetical protein [Hydrogenophaga sp.]|uniref:hypothetical protein n=1 Tax=Hydrogenophaga sp. TaxID=1904254 RepID=UPI0025BB2AC4|nr:hypothetical protein [Hydrogenophaga sp.]